MLLNRLFGKISFNWKYAVGEVFLIFIGITLSLAFDEWRTSKADKKREQELLVELREAIKRDTSKLSYQIQMCNTLIRNMDYLKDNLAKSQTLTDSLSYCLAWINTSAGFTADYSAYQSLMAIGIINVSSNQLRRDIIGYYTESDRLKGWNETLINRLNNYIDPFLMQEFDEFNREKSVVPVDFNRLKNNREFRYFIKKSHELYQVALMGLEFHKKYSSEFLKKLPTD